MPLLNMKAASEIARDVPVVLHHSLLLRALLELLPSLITVSANEVSLNLQFFHVLLEAHLLTMLGQCI